MTSTWVGMRFWLLGAFSCVAESSHGGGPLNTLKYIKIMSKTTKKTTGKVTSATGKASAATAQQLLNAQKVDGAIITDTQGNIAFRKAIWNEAEVLSDRPQVIAGRIVCTGDGMGDLIDFHPYAQTGEKIFDEKFRNPHCVVRATKRKVQVNYTFSKDLSKEDMLRYLRGEHKEVTRGFKESEL